MSKTSISRREFVGIAVAAALGATAEGSKFDAASLDSVAVDVPVSVGRKLGTEAEMAMAADWARSFFEPIGSARSKANTRLLPQVLLPPFSFLYDGKSRRTFYLNGKWTQRLSMVTSHPACLR